MNVRVLLVALAGACGGASTDVPDGSGGAGTADAVPLDGPTAAIDAAAVRTRPARPTDVPIAVTFSLNLQDFDYVDESIGIVRQAIALHDELEIPVDVYLTTTMVDRYRERGFLAELTASPWVEVCYHTRPPVPYRANYIDWLGLGDMPPDERQTTIVAYETHRLDLESGMPTDADGSYRLLGELIGHPPRAVGNAADPALQPDVDQVFRELGARFAVAHAADGASGVDLGAMRNGLYLRPEHIDERLFEEAGADGGAALEADLAAVALEDGEAPIVIGVKMHDNDFIAEESAWLYHFLHRAPPVVLTGKATPKSAEERARMWALYESAVRWAAAHPDTLPALGVHDFDAALE